MVAYGRIIPPWMLALPRLGCINLHASLLPKYRGAAPIQWAVAMGETVTGNTTMLLEEGLDTGPILLQQEVAIGPEQTAADLFDVLATSGAPLVVETLAGLADGSIQPKPQNHAQATLAPLLDARRRAYGFCGAHGDGTEESLARISALAWGVHGARRQKADCASHGGRGKHATSHVPSQAEPGAIRGEQHRMLVACAQNTWLELT